MNSTTATGHTAPADAPLSARFAWHLRRLSTIALAGLLYGTVWALVTLAGMVWGDGGAAWSLAAMGLGLISAIAWYATERVENRYTTSELLDLLRRTLIIIGAGISLLMFTGRSAAAGSVELGFFVLAAAIALAWHTFSLPKR